MRAGIEGDEGGESGMRERLEIEGDESGDRGGRGKRIGVEGVGAEIEGDEGGDRGRIEAGIEGDEGGDKRRRWSGEDDLEYFTHSDEGLFQTSNFTI